MSNDAPDIIRRPDKGLTISGTRVTLYALLDYIHAGWSDDEIREWLNLSDEQLRVAHEYIAAHRDTVEAEYRDVLSQAEERKRQWAERLRDHLARTPAAPPSAEKSALYAKLAEQRGQTLKGVLHDNATESSETAQP